MQLVNVQVNKKSKQSLGDFFNRRNNKYLGRGIADNLSHVHTRP